MRVKLSREEAVYLRDQLDMWIEGYSDIDIEDDMPSDVVVELLRNREMAESIREKVRKRV